MKAIIIGQGSIGKRHAANILTLYPETLLVTADPRFNYTGYGVYRSAGECINNNLDADFAVIASPTPYHMEQMDMLAHCGIPFLVEKPPCESKDFSVSDYGDLVQFIEDEVQFAAAVGFQYRFHPVIEEHKDEWQSHDHFTNDFVSFTAQDSLLDRYGATCLETMATHPLDTAHYIWGESFATELESDGVSVGGRTYHGRATVDYQLAMNRSPRESSVSVNGKKFDLYPNDEMYVREMKSFIEWVMTGRKDERLATLRDGLRVMRVAGKCRMAADDYSE